MNNSLGALVFLAVYLEPIYFDGFTFSKADKQMGLLGTIIGGSLGLLVGGPLGALIGGALGSNINIKTERVHPGSRPHHGGDGHPGTGYPGGGRPHIQEQQTFLVGLISLAAKVAKADGQVTSDEVRTFDQFLKNNLRMDQEERQVAARIFNDARDSAVPAEEFARQIRQIIGYRRDRLRDLISLLLMIANADGVYHPAEERMIRSIAATLGLTAKDYEAAAAMFAPVNNLETSYSILGVDRSATDAEVKHAYRQLAREYHPDRLASKGMSDDFKDFAEDKMKSINAAYDEVKKARGI